MVEVLALVDVDGGHHTQHQHSQHQREDEAIGGNGDNDGQR